MSTATITETAARPDTPSARDQGGMFARFESVWLRNPQVEWAILGALIVIMIAQLWTSVVQLSVTSDEIDHLHAAYRYWQCNDFGWNPEHPPLVKIVAGLPLQFMKIADPIPNACGAHNDKSIDFLAGRQFLLSNPESMLTAARFAVSLYAVLLLVAVWFFARKLFGVPVAVIAGVLVAFDPNLLAHGALVTTDIAAAVAMVLAVYALYCYVADPGSTRLVALGLAVGFALCAKHSSILLACILPILLLADLTFFTSQERGRKLLRYAGALVATAGIALIVLWAAYGFRYAARPGGAAVWTPATMERAHGVVATRLIPLLESWRVAPQSYLVGLQDVMVRSEIGVPSFILGKIYPSGRWFYFPVAMAVKYTVPTLAMLLISAASSSFWKSKKKELLFLVWPALAYLVFSMSSKLNIGSRHILPILPLLIIFAAAGVWNLARLDSRVAIILVSLLLFQILSSIHSYPNYLAYSNEVLGGSANTYRYLAYSDADWGQAQKMARAYLDKTKPANCLMVRTYNNKHADYSIPCQGISEIEWDPLETPYTGTMVVSSTLVDGVGLRGMDWETRRVFKDLKPVAQLGGDALLVYQGTFDLSPMVAAQLRLEARTRGEGDPQLAMQLASRAESLDPTNGDAHVIMCGSYQAMGDIEQAERECNTGLALIRHDPKYYPEQVKYLEQFILNKGLKIYGSQ